MLAECFSPFIPFALDKILTKNALNTYMDAWSLPAVVIFFLGARLTKAVTRRGCRRLRGSLMTTLVLYLLACEIARPWKRAPAPADNSRDPYGEGPKELSVIYGPEGLQKHFVTMLEVLAAARRLRLLREGVHPNPGPGPTPRPRKDHGPSSRNHGPPSRKNELRDLKLASFNLGFSLEDKLVRDSLEDVLHHEGVDIAALQEVATGKLRRCAFDGERYAFFVSKGDASCKPVGFAVKRALIDQFGTPTVDCFGPRIALLRWRQLGLHYLCGYAPVRSRERVAMAQDSPAEAARRAFWRQLTAVYIDSKKDNSTTFLAGDFNAEISCDDDDDELFTVAEDNADFLLEMIALHQLVVGNWKGTRAEPGCYTFLGAGNAEPATLDYILVPESRSKHIVGFLTVDKNKFLRKRTNHKLLVLRVHLYLNRAHKRSRDTVSAVVPSFSAGQSTPVGTRYAAFAARVHDMHKKGLVEKLPTLDHEYVSDRTKELTARSDMAKAEHPVCHTVVLELYVHLQQSKRDDKKAALREFAKDIADTFASPHQADVYRMLNHLTRARGCLKAHVRDNAKLEMLDHYMKLLGNAPPTPDFPYLGDDHGPKVLPRPLPEHGHTVVLYTDGSYFNELGIAGWSFVDVRTHLARCGNLPAPEAFMSANTRMSNSEFHCAFAEAYAVLEGLRAFPDHNLTFFVDSQSTIDTFNALHYLQQSDFREVPFAHVWKEIFLLSRGRAIQCEKVAAHMNIEYNEQADVLAKFGAHLGHGAARSIQCPNGHWWAPANARFNLTAGGASSRLVSLWNDEIKTWGYSAFATLLPPRFTPELVPLAADDGPPTKREVRHAISLLTDVTPGADGILMKMCKDEEVFDELFALIVEIWNTGTIPAEWQQSIMVSLKKNPHQDLGPQNCRGISLTSIPSRILTRIILERGAGAGIHQAQMGFRRAQGAPQAQLIVRQAVRAANLGMTPMILTFVDLVKAFDMVDRRKLPEVLRRYGYGRNAARLMQAMWDDEVALKFPDGTYSKAFRTKVGTKQGDVCSPFIFNLYMDLAIRDILPRLSGATLRDAAGVNELKLIMYADDIVLFATSPQAASANLALLEAALKPTGLKINVTKTKTLHAASPESPRQDSNVGYINRMRRQGKHRDQHPNATRTVITYALENGVVCGKMTMQATCGEALCPHETCPFVATHGCLGNIKSMERHLFGRHNIKKIDTTLQPDAPTGSSDPDPNSRADVAPSVARRPEGYMSYVHLNEKYLERVLRFKYLGSIISEDGSLDSEIEHRIGAARSAFHKLPRELWASEDVPLYVKWELYKHLVLSRLLYGAEAWAPTDTHIRRLEAVYIRHLRVLSGLTTVFEETNDGVVSLTTPPRAKVSETMDEPRLLDVLRTFRLRLYGQIKRAGQYSFLHQWAHAEPPHMDTAPRGPRREAWHEMVTADLYALNIHDTTPAYSRRKWKEVTLYRPRGPKKPEFPEEDWE